MLVATIGAENLTGGLGTAAFVAYLSNLCDREWTASQYALLTALSGLLRSVFSSASGELAQWLGWVPYFGLTTAAAVPGLVLLAALVYTGSISGTPRRAAQ
jgi:PAT family beta-lactamase induction signal transducer AmpG